MTEAEQKITREVYDHINSCSLGDLMKLYLFLFGRTETYVQVEQQIEGIHE